MGANTADFWHQSVYTSVHLCDGMMSAISWTFPSSCSLFSANPTYSPPPLPSLQVYAISSPLRRLPLNNLSHLVSSHTKRNSKHYVSVNCRGDQEYQKYRNMETIAFHTSLFDSTLSYCLKLLPFHPPFAGFISTGVCRTTGEAHPPFHIYASPPPHPSFNVQSLHTP